MSTCKAFKILVVDDEEIVRHTLKAILNRLGYHVEGVEDGLTGLRVIETGDYHAAFVDIRMPGLDGISLLRQVKKIRPNISIIIISGHGSDETRKEAMQAGAFAFLHKPFRFKDIQELMKKIARFDSVSC